MMRRARLALLTSLAAFSSAHGQASAGSVSVLPLEYQRLAADVITQAVNTNTTASTGSTTALARKLRARLIAAGYPAGDIHIAGGDRKNQNLVVRLRGAQTGKRPILLAAH